MSCLHYREQSLSIEDVSLAEIAHQYGTPTYVYSQNAILNNLRAYQAAFKEFPTQICYAVKANSNLAILQLLAKHGSGFDIVSLGELKRVVAAGGRADKVIFSGVGKTSVEIEEAMKLGIFCFNVESEPELTRIADIATKLQKKVNIMLRINPNVDAKTHSYISTGMRENKFGMDLSDVVSLVTNIQAMPSLQLVGVGAHIGSQITDMAPFLKVLEHLLVIQATLRELGSPIKYLNIGGGLGITYRNETPPTVMEYARALLEKLAGQSVILILEPGRSIIGNAGVLLTKVEYIKNTGSRHFAITDAGMNDLVRPALYQAWQEILPVKQHSKLPPTMYDITGPVCESSDFLGKDRELALEPGDLLTIDCAGAYGFCMSSNYNSRCRAAEVMVNGDHSFLIRRRETIDDLLALDKLIQE